MKRCVILHQLQVNLLTNIVVHCLRPLTVFNVKKGLNNMLAQRSLTTK